MPKTPGTSCSTTSPRSRQQIARALQGLTNDEVIALYYDWATWARKKQLPPPGDWIHWLILAGRGFGKTRTGAEWIRDRVESGQARHIHLIARTSADVRDTMVEGESGLLRISPPWNTPKYEPSKRRITWPNGAVATTFSADEPDALRGPQCDTYWADELASWRFLEDAWSNLMFGFRLGKNPRGIITTTPRPVKQLREIMQDTATVIVTGHTMENIDNLAPAFKRFVIEKYEGTRLGRQELAAELLEDAPGALWQRATIERLRVTKAPELTRIVVAVDPSVTATETSDECGIVAAGIGVDGHGYVLQDASDVMTASKWAEQAVAIYHQREADVIVAEVNNGGDLVEINIRQVDKTVGYKSVRASRGKQTRAEPISLLYEKGQVHHVGTFPELEDELCQWEPKGKDRSPNRLDALVWALTELMIGGTSWWDEIAAGAGKADA